MLAALLGASKNIGYLVLLDLLAASPTNRAVLLLRKPECFDSDPVISDAIAQGRVTVVQGDATSVDDVRKLFVGRSVDVVVTSIGGTPTFTLGGFRLTDPTVCTRATAALITVLTELDPIPRVVAISSMGIGPEHHIMPLPLRIVYPWMLSGPHADKHGLEYLYQRAARAFPTPPPADLPPAHILDASACAAAPENVLPEVTIVRPALLTDGVAKGAPLLKAAEGLGTYSCSRKDVAQFIARECLPGARDEWVNRCPVLGY